MRTIFFIFTLLISACAQNNPIFIDGENIGQTSNKKIVNQASLTKQANDKRYQNLISSVQTDPTTANYKALREIYIHTSYYRPYVSPERADIKNMIIEMRNSNWDNCLTKANNILTYNYISLGAHYGAINCYDQQENSEQVRFHKQVLDKLLAAIWETGDGGEIQSAFYCTSTQELYDFIHLHGLEPINQALLHHEGKSYDVMDIRDPRNSFEFTWYFDISSQWALGFKGLVKNN